MCSCPRMSVDILKLWTNCDQCGNNVHCCFTSTETVRLIMTERQSPGWPPRLSHRSQLLNSVNFTIFNVLFIFILGMVIGRSLYICLCVHATHCEEHHTVTLPIILPAGNCLWFPFVQWWIVLHPTNHIQNLDLSYPAHNVLSEH